MWCPFVEAATQAIERFDEREFRAARRAFCPCNFHFRFFKNFEPRNWWLNFHCARIESSHACMHALPSTAVRGFKLSSSSKDAFLAPQSPPCHSFVVTQREICLGTAIFVAAGTTYGHTAQMPPEPSVRLALENAHKRETQWTNRVEWFEAGNRPGACEPTPSTRVRLSYISTSVADCRESCAPYASCIAIEYSRIGRLARCRHPLSGRHRIPLPPQPLPPPASPPSPLSLDTPP